MPVPPSDPEAFDRVIQAEARALRAGDQPPASLLDWNKRRPALRMQLFAAMGSFPEQPCSLEARVTGELKRPGYRIEKLVFQSRPNVWVTASFYVPASQGKHPAVLAVHGHWPGARRDPVVQARCLGLVKLGFLVLAIDAFGAGERYPVPAHGAYHGALFGSTLWPAGHTLLGMQVYDNRRAVDYLRTRPEVDGDRLGITGASGGGNQTMYAGALDERFRAVVPVCSVGNYLAYLRAACCVCEVLPAALRFTDEGDVLGLVAPRALMVISASKDAYQFSVEQAQKSLERARIVYRLHRVPGKVRHAVFDSGHAYNQPMREAMYGWMTRWLKNEGDGRPIPEPAHQIDSDEDLCCVPPATRPKGFLFPPTFAAQEARRLLKKLTEPMPDHVEAWESTAIAARHQLREQVLGGLPESNPAPVIAETRNIRVVGEHKQTPLQIECPGGPPLPAVLMSQARPKQKQPACVLLHLDGKARALEHPLAGALLKQGYAVVAPDLRATGCNRPPHDAIGGAPDHNSAEHALWIGRPLLGQWVIDVRVLLDWLRLQAEFDYARRAVAGIGHAGVVALCAAGLLENHVAAALAIAAPASYITDEAYPAGFPMGLLAPGLLRLADVPQLAALVAPRRLVVADSTSSQGKKLGAPEQRDSFAFASDIYKLYREPGKLTLAQTMRMEELIKNL